jgi:hypothetical protein
MAKASKDMLKEWTFEHYQGDATVENNIQSGLVSVFFGESLILLALR